MNLKKQRDVSSNRELDVQQDKDSSVDRLAAGAVISILGVGIGRGLDFVKQIAMARLLGPELFGFYAIGWNFLRIFGVLVPLGLHNGVVHFATQYWRKDNGSIKSIVGRAILISFLIGWAVSIFLFIIAPWLTAELFKEPGFLPYFRVFILMLPFMGALRVAANASRISQRMQYAILSEEIAQSIVNILLFVVFYALGWQLWGAIVSTVLSFAVAFFVSLYYLRKLFPHAYRTSARSVVTNRTLLTYSIPTALAGIFSVIISRVDRIFLGYFWPASDVGIYQAAAQISVIMALILNAFNMILTPMIADLYHKQDMAKLEELFRINTKWGIYCVVPVVLVILFSAEDVMQVLFGIEYIAGSTALILLTIGQFINIATGATGMLLIMTNHQGYWFKLSMVIMIVNLILNLTLIPRWGMNGAALATAMTVGGLFLIGLLIVRMVLRIWPYDRRYFKGLGAALAAFILLMGVNVLNLSPLPNLLLTSITALITFFGVLLVLGLDDEDREFLGFITKRIGQG